MSSDFEQSKFINLKKYERYTKLNQSEGEVVASLLSTIKITKRDSSTLRRYFVTLNCTIFALSTIGGIVIACKHYWTIKYLDIFGGYDQGAIFKISVGICFITGFISILGIFISCLELFEIKRKKSKFVIIMYLWWLAGLIVMDIGVIVMVYFMITTVGNIFKGGFQTSMLQFEKVKDIQTKIDFMQASVRCCGMTNFKDWFKVTWSDTIQVDSIGFPKSCCDFRRFPLDGCVHVTKFQQEQKLTPWIEGCYKKVEDAYSNDLKTIIIIMAVLKAAQLFNFVFIIINVYWMKKKT